MCAISVAVPVNTSLFLCLRAAYDLSVLPSFSFVTTVVCLVQEGGCLEFGLHPVDTCGDTGCVSTPERAVPK